MGVKAKFLDRSINFSSGKATWDKRGITFIWFQLASLYELQLDSFNIFRLYVWGYVGDHQYMNPTVFLHFQNILNHNVN